MIHVNVEASGAGHDLLDLDGRVRLRVGLALFCDVCQCHVDLPVDAGPVSVAFGDLDAVVAAHEAGHR